MTEQDDIHSDIEHNTETAVGLGKGLDVGTANLAAAVQNDEGGITGIETPIRVSAPGSANTCGYFHPVVPYVIIFGSTIAPPADEAPAGYGHRRGRCGAARFRFGPEGPGNTGSIGAETAS